jgi:DNA-binding transcriptional ArsR family regulator
LGAAPSGSRGCGFKLSAAQNRPVEPQSQPRAPNLQLQNLQTCQHSFLRHASILSHLANSQYDSHSRLPRPFQPQPLQILAWLRQPKKHFPPQIDGDLIKDGVCGLLIAKKLRISQPTASEHLKILLQAGLIRGKRIKQWTFYKRNEPAIRALKKEIATEV